MVPFGLKTTFWVIMQKTVIFPDSMPVQYFGFVLFKTVFRSRSIKENLHVLYYLGKLGTILFTNLVSNMTTCRRKRGHISFS